MLYRIQDGTVSIGGEVILSHIDFEIKGAQKIALVGRNGAGKTTLLRLLAGELELDRDDRRTGTGIVTDRAITVGMLRQTPQTDQEKTIEELLLEACPEGDSYSRERYDYEKEYDRLFTGFGFDKKDKSRKLGTFSGGQQTRIALIRLLLMKPDILLLDEPTNHLDIQTVEWLETYLKDYNRAVVMVSHDRFFLDQVAQWVYELRNGKLWRYPGNYTEYRRQYKKELELTVKAYERQQQELARLNELVERFKNKPKKAAFARSRKKIMERMEQIQKPEQDQVHIFTGEIAPRTLGSKWVIEAEHLQIGYDRALLEVSLRIKRGQKIGIIGDNGVGKSTLLKTIAGLIPPVKGKCILGNHTELGYFDQQSAGISSDKTVLEHFQERFPGMTEKDARQTLGMYLFGGKQASVRVSALSGGEKSRLLLAELLVSRPNLLLLDEPTNHMDIQAKETLESAFQKYTGTILFVSHDRYFVDQVADGILVLEESSVLYYPFGYGHYAERKKRQAEAGIAGLVQAEEEALIAGIRAVPQAERHRLRELGTEEAYYDWQLRLVEEQLEQAQGEVARLSEAVECRRLELLSNPDQDLTELTEKLQAACDRWTTICLQWNDLFCEAEKVMPASSR